MGRPTRISPATCAGSRRFSWVIRRPRTNRRSSAARSGVRSNVRNLRNRRVRDGFAADEATVDAHARHARAPRPGRRRAPGAPRRTRRARPSPAVDRRPLAGRAPADGATRTGAVWITYNGEVYNHEALRAELQAKGHRFRSRTDTEAILHLYEEEGPGLRASGSRACSRSRSGTARRRELFLARDRIGVKPLYYATISPAGWCSPRRSRRCSSTQRSGATSTRHAFFDYLTFAFTPPPATMYRGHLEARAGRADDRARRRLDRALDAIGVRSRRTSPARSRACRRARWCSGSATSCASRSASG